MAGAAAHAPTDDHAANYAEIARQFALEARRDRYGRRHCAWVRLAAKRHLEDLKRQRRKAFAYRFDEWHANDVCDFIEKLPHVEGEWEHPELQLEPAQVFILVAVFGWRRKADGGRRFSRVYIEMARKGAKSTLTAGVALYCLACEGAVGPQVIIGATTGDQANKVFLPAKRMAERTPELLEAFGLNVWAKSITCEDNGGFIQTINAKSSTQDGWNPHVGILDELHAHKDRGLYDVIRSAFGARKNPLLWTITTAGYNVDGVCYEQRALLTKILEGVVTAEHYFGIIFTLDEKDDPLDESKWVKANPLLGITPTLEEMQAYAKEAAASPGTMGEFRTKRLNVWTSAKGGWINMPKWRRCDGAVDLQALKGQPCWAGLDLAINSDFAAFVLVWRHDDRCKVHPRFYLPEEEARITDDDDPNRDLKLQYQAWAREGYITLTPGDVCDYAFIEADIDEALAEFDVQEIGFDRWNSSYLVNNLTDKGAPMVQMAQGPRTFNAPMVELQRSIKARTLDHGGHPVLDWMASNIVARTDVNENLAPDKKHSTHKIDGIVALLMGLGRAIVGEDDTHDAPFIDLAGRG